MKLKAYALLFVLATVAAFLGDVGWGP